MSITKATLFDEALHLIEGDDNEQILKYIFDFFNTAEMIEFIEHIKQEKGV